MGRMRVLAHHTHTQGTQYTHYTKHTHTTHTPHTHARACTVHTTHPWVFNLTHVLQNLQTKKLTLSEMKHQKILNCKSNFFISDWLSDLPIIMEHRQAQEANMAEILEGRHIIPCKRHRVPVNGRKYCVHVCVFVPLKDMIVECVQSLSLFSVTCTYRRVTEKENQFINV